jgi:hypothetical protein
MERREEEYVPGATPAATGAAKRHVGRNSMATTRNRRGIALAWTAIVLIVMIGMVGLSVDWGKLTWNVHQMQNGGDAGALAGAHVVKFNWENATDPDGARQRAIRFAAANIADQRIVDLDLNASNDPNGELVLGRWIRQDSIFIPTMVAPNAVKVSVRRRSQRETMPRHQLLFGPIFGTHEVGTTRDSIAASIASTGAGIICLSTDPNAYQDKASGPGYPPGGPKPWIDEDTSGLVRDGGCEVDLRGPDGMIGDIQVNAISVEQPKAGLLIDGVSGKIWAGEINVVGGTNPTEGWDSYYGDPDLPFSVNPQSPYVADPLLTTNQSPPNIATMPRRDCPNVSNGATATIEPGWYPAGINPEGGTINMNPGVYAVGGGTKAAQITGLAFNGGVLNGNGVMIYVTGDPDGSKTGTATYWGQVDIGAQANVQLVSRGDAMTPAQIDGEIGVVLWQDIDNHNEASVFGGSGSRLRGTLYFPDAPLRLGGGVNQMGSQVLAGALHIAGNVTLGIAYDGRNTVKAFRSALVK